jgi:hypothetical protein
VPATTTVSTTTTTTTTTTVPATTSVAPVVSISESAAGQVIGAYYAAYRARDFTALQAIFPGATDLDRRRIEALRKDYEPCDYVVQELAVDPISSTRAYVRLQVTETCRPRIRVAFQPNKTAKTFQLGRTADGRWIITTGP